MRNDQTLTTPIERECRVSWRLAMREAEDDLATEEMIAAGERAYRAAPGWQPGPGQGYAPMLIEVYRAMRRAKREAFKPLPSEEAESLREFLP